jgi:hypothetical protein
MFKTRKVSELTQKNFICADLPFSMNTKELIWHLPKCTHHSGVTPDLLIILNLAFSVMTRIFLFIVRTNQNRRY